jgi:hypothetical protein
MAENWIIAKLIFEPVDKSSAVLMANRSKN